MHLASLQTAKKVVLQTVTMANSLSERKNTDVEFSSYFEDKINNELEDSDPDYDVNADPLTKAQCMRHV